MKKNAPEIFISVDVEASGPIPGDYSLLSVGACLVANPARQFYAELQPISDKSVPEALAVSKLSMDHLKARGQAPGPAFQEFEAWILKNAGLGTPIFVGFNACFDWAFVNWYFHHFIGHNPFGFSAIDMKAYYMGKANCRWSETSFGQLPVGLRPEKPLAHNALQDAIAQGEIFRKLISSRQLGSDFTQGNESGPT